MIKKHPSPLSETDMSTQEQPSHDTPIPMRLLCDFWDENGIRHHIGDIVFFDVPTAKTLLSLNKVERIDPLPGKISSP